MPNEILTRSEVADEQSRTGQDIVLNALFLAFAGFLARFLCSDGVSDHPSGDKRLKTE